MRDPRFATLHSDPAFRRERSELERAQRRLQRDRERVQQARSGLLWQSVEKVSDRLLALERVRRRLLPKLAEMPLVRRKRLSTLPLKPLKPN